MNLKQQTQMTDSRQAPALDVNGGLEAVSMGTLAAVTKGATEAE